MKKILITGSTDGIGFETAKSMLNLGHTIIIHGRTTEKVRQTLERLKKTPHTSILDGFTADLTDMEQVKELAINIINKYGSLDVLVNNAGVYQVPNAKTVDNLDVRFVVNTIAPYYLTKLLLPIMGENSRVVNISSATQAPINFNDLKSYTGLSAGEAYAQSKLAILMWGIELSKLNPDKVIVSINPKSYLGSKMVRDAYGVQGHPLSIGADIQRAAALSTDFNNANGKYFDNDRGIFTYPHPFAMNETNRKTLIENLNDLL